MNEPMYWDGLRLRHLLERIEKVIDIAPENEIPHLFRQIPLDVFGQLLINRPAQFPKINRFLPAMPPDEIQKRWTGGTGHALMAQSCAFVKSMQRMWLLHRGTTWDTQEVLDYGCGWGRILRLMYKFFPASQLYGVDAWPNSLSLCMELGLPGKFSLCDEVPTGPPITGQKFNIIYSFSVLTHLAENCHRAVVKSLRQSISEDGMLFVTIRPETFWDNARDRSIAEQMKRCHMERGFAFHCNSPQSSSRNKIFGDASIALSYVEKHWLEWRLAEVDVNLCDRWQTVLALTPC